jgi:transcriptional regulator of arginine metabolism
MTESTRILSKASRHARITELLSQGTVSSQGELQRLLAADGLAVTQTTVSRDLIELRAEKVRAASGALVYAVPGEGGDRTARTQTEGYHAARLRRLAADFLVSAEASANNVVLRTPPGAANLLAAAIDHSAMPHVLGCLAGDDTILVITRDPDGGAAVAAEFLALAVAAPTAP